MPRANMSLLNIFLKKIDQNHNKKLILDQYASLKLRIAIISGNYFCNLSIMSIILTIIKEYRETNSR